VHTLYYNALLVLYYCYNRQSGDIPDRGRTFSILYRAEGSAVDDPLSSLDIECDDDKVSVYTYYIYY
jgi:hypothetical protein